MGSVRERRDFVEKVICVRAADDLEHAVFGCCNYRASAEFFRTRNATTTHRVTAQHVSLVALDQRLAGSAGLLLDAHCNVAAVSLCGVCDELFDCAGSEPSADDVGDVEAAAFGM
ncbi:MAG TPA: hypothetical protein VIL77_14705 [Gaiellaceae bacterium]